MNIPPTRIAYLWQQFNNKLATRAELDELFELVSSDRQDEESREYLQQLLAATPPEALDKERWEPVLRTILSSSGPSIVPVRRVYRWRRGLVAAAILILLVTGGYLWQQAKKEGPVATRSTVPSVDILPGGSKAILTLSGGRRLVLDSTAEDTILTEGAAIIANAGGRLAYNAGKSPEEEIAYNTLTTPRGGQYQLTLPDGTRVWLNAASSITYPTVFTGIERKVTITGEAYLEVAREAAHPFIVSAENTQVEVLGTSFNINAYTDEPGIRTTLLEGSIAVKTKGLRRAIRPGQQTMVPFDENTISITDSADLDQAVAWKNDRFAFTMADLPTVMRQLARWYNVEVEYEGTIPQRHFTGRIGRSLTLDQVLKGLTKARVHYNIEPGNKLIIRP
ncbi:MAG TPA: FecR domain-containing protein [Puia sp.]|jgi:ferric-dicitrate binding protein FerR (iron transport regulator)